MNPIWRRVAETERSCLKFLHGAADADNVPVELDEQERREVGRKARAAVLCAVQALGGQGARQDILERALSGGEFTSRELGAAAPDTAQAKYATYVEYRLSWTLTNLKRDGLLENPRWSLWRLSGAAAQEPAESEYPINSERIAELRAMPYRDYLRTPEWCQTRAAALERAGHRCSLDHTHSDHLEVHHNTYDRLGAELPSDVVVLCQACHRVHHNAYGRPRRSPAPALTNEAAATRVAHPSDAGQSEAGRPAAVGSPVRTRSWLRRILAGA